jgi:hypothetical protein
MPGNVRCVECGSIGEVTWQGRPLCQPCADEVCDQELRELRIDILMEVLKRGIECLDQ